ncbi:MAG: hypothetical protein QXL85_00995 [Candidatus Bathyarchaeia archaeon]
MPNEFELWFLPHNLRAAYERAATLLKSVDFDILYLHAPRELNWLVDELALGAPYEQFMETVQKISNLRESLNSWEYRFKPILLTIRGLRLRKPSLKIICYRSIFSENLSVKDAEDVAKLILRTNVTGRVDVEEWRNVVSRIINNISSSVNEESDYIFKTWIKIGEGRKTVCLSDYPAREIIKRMRKFGIKAFLRYVFTPYCFMPLEVLIREFIITDKRKLDISDERVTTLARMHVEFVREYILTSDNYDEAYFKWLRNVGQKLILS